MNSLKGPLLIIAAALFWLGGASFYGSDKGAGHFLQYSGNASFVAAGILLVWGVVETVRAR